MAKTRADTEDAAVAQGEVSEVHAIGADMTVLSFSLGGRLCGFDIGCVQEVLQMVDLAAVPDAPGYVAGALNLRGSVLPVIDLAALLGTERQPYTLDTPIVVIRENDRRLGLIVDEVHDVLGFSTEDVDPPSDLFPVRGVLAGVARTHDGLMMLFDLARVVELAAGAEVRAASGEASGVGGAD